MDKIYFPSRLNPQNTHHQLIKQTQRYNHPRSRRMSPIFTSDSPCLRVTPHEPKVTKSCTMMSDPALIPIKLGTLLVYSIFSNLEQQISHKDTQSNRAPLHTAPLHTAPLRHKEGVRGSFAVSIAVSNGASLDIHKILRSEPPPVRYGTPSFTLQALVRR